MTELVFAAILALAPTPPAPTQEPPAQLQDTVATPAPSPPRAQVAPRPTPDAWQRRIRLFAQRAGDPSRVAGRVLYDSLALAVTATQRELVEALDREDSDLAHDLDADMVELHDVRDSLIALLDPETRSNLFGVHQTGWSEVGGELRFFLLHSRYEAVAVRTTLQRGIATLIADPVGWVPESLKLALAVLVFLWWRRTGVRKLETWRQRLIEIRPIRRQNVRLAKSLWYFDYVRPPLEWLVLLAVVVKVTAARTFGPALFFWATAKWILIGWAAVLYVDALAARGAVGRRGRAHVRRKSLWLLCWWIVFFALGRQLVRDFFGQGALFHWVSVGLLLLLVPIAVTLVVWWRDDVIEQLRSDQTPPRFVEGLLAYDTGPRSYLVSLVGGLYLTFDTVRRWVLRVTAGSELGRRMIAQLSRSEIARQAERQSGAIQGDPLPDTTRRALLNGDAPLIDKVGRQLVTELADLFSTTEGAAAVLVGEQGSGKSTHLMRLAERLEERAVVVSCPVGSFDALLRSLADALGLSSDADVAAVCAALAGRVKPVVLIDDIHRLARPVIGGSTEVERLRDLTREAGTSASWLLSSNAAGWEYFRRFRELEPVHYHVSYLEPWGEEEIGRLIDSRCEAAQVRPDYTRLVLPRQLDERTYESLEARNKAGFTRVLWDDCDGNPAVALHLWTDSLVVVGGRVVVRLSHPPAPGDLEALAPDAFFILRTLLRLESASEEELVSCLPIDPDAVEDTLQLARTMGMIRAENGRMSLNWRWYRAVSRALTRRNMIAPVGRMT